MGSGRSRGELTTKIQSAVDGKGLLLAIVVTGRQRNDGAMLIATLEGIYSPRKRGWARTTPEKVLYIVAIPPQGTGFTCVHA